MQPRVQLFICCVTFNLAIFVGLRTEADFIMFDDSQPGGITVTANGFIGAPLTLDGSIVLTNNTFVNQSIVLPKNQDITFVGTDTNHHVPASFSAIYDYVYSSALTNPVSELILTGTAIGPDSECTPARSQGLLSASLPATMPAGAITEVIGSAAPGIATFVIGADPHAYATTFSVAEPTGAVPEPSTFVLFAMAITGMRLVRWRRNNGGKAAASVMSAGALT